MLVKDEIGLIAQCLFLRGSASKVEGARLYRLEGTEVNDSHAQYIVHDRAGAHNFAKNYVAKMSQYEFGTPYKHGWSLWVMARRNSVDFTHGDGFYDQFMKRILK